MFCGFIFTTNFRPVSNTLIFFVAINFSVRRNIFSCLSSTASIHQTKIDPFVELQICFLKSRIYTCFREGKASVKSLGSRLVSGNSHENSGPVVMEMASTRTKIRHFFRRHFLSTSRFSSNVIAQWSRLMELNLLSIAISY